VSLIHKMEGITQSMKKFNVGENQEFELPEKYEFVRALGKGAYGFVCLFKIGSQGDKEVAVKKVKIQEEMTEARRVYREIKILQNMDHPNVLKIVEIVAQQDYSAFNTVFLATDFYPADLQQIIKSSQKLTDAHVQTFMYQLFRGLKYIHSANVLHRDLKPNNILVNRQCDLVICDFGLARMHDESDEDADMTQYVVTRWYRAPELIMLVKDYDAAIDVWSAGCIMAELITRKPIFPGADYVKQLECIIKVVGTPSKEDIANMKGNERASRYAASLGSGPGSKVPSLLQPFEAAPLAIDLIDKCLAFNPTSRITAEGCLEHMYMAAVRDASSELESKSPLDPGDFVDVERSDISLDEVKTKIFSEIAIFRKTTEGR